MDFSLPPSRAHGEVELIFDGEHFQQVVLEGMAKARVSLDITTADFKAMLIPAPGSGTLGGRRGRSRAESIVALFRKLADRGVEIRLLHAGVPSGPALKELRRELPEQVVIRRCPRLHAKSVIVDCRVMYLGSANLTGAGLGAKGEHRRNFEWGVWTKSGTLIDAVQVQFNALWEGERCESCQRKNVCPVPLEEPEL